MQYFEIYKVSFPLAKACQSYEGMINEDEISLKWVKKTYSWIQDAIFQQCYSYLLASQKSQAKLRLRATVAISRLSSRGKSGPGGGLFDVFLSKMMKYRLFHITFIRPSNFAATGHFWGFHVTVAGLQETFADFTLNENGAKKINIYYSELNRWKKILLSLK